MTMFTSTNAQPRALILSAALLAAGACTATHQAQGVSHAIEAPQSSKAPEASAIGREFRGEISKPEETDEYRIDGTEGQELHVLLQGLSGRSTVGVDLTVFNTMGNARLASVHSGGHAKVLEENSTELFVLPEQGTYIIRVTGEHREGYRNTYRFKILERNRAPETVSAMISPGQVVMGERIDLPHDIDEFQIEGRKGQTLQVFLQGLSGRSTVDVDLAIFGPSGNRRIAQVRSGGHAKTLEQNASRVITLPETGTYIVQVSGRFDIRTENPYRFRLDVNGEGVAVDAPGPREDAPGAHSGGLEAEIAKHFPGWRLSTEQDIAARTKRNHGVDPKTVWSEVLPAGAWGSGRTWWVWPADFDSDGRDDHAIILTKQDDPTQDRLVVIHANGTASTAMTKLYGLGVSVSPPNEKHPRPTIGVIAWEKGGDRLIWSGGGWVEASSVANRR